MLIPVRPIIRKARAAFCPTQVYAFEQRPQTVPAPTLTAAAATVSNQHYPIRRNRPQFSSVAGDSTPARKLVNRGPSQRDRTVVVNVFVGGSRWILVDCSDVSFWQSNRPSL